MSQDPPVTLTEQEWQQVLACLANAPWTVANPLLMKIGDQLRAHQARKWPEQDLPEPLRKSS